MARLLKCLSQSHAPNVTLDGNHPLAGEEVTMTIQLLEIGV